MTEVKQLHEVGGLMSCLFTHEVQKSSVAFKWTGPKLSWETWRQVLAFFRWTNTEHHSESQVRFFVNHRLNLWAAHAFPQEARTGMSTTELDTPDAVAQRARFSDAEGWLYWGTAHHHCSGGAFQSGTDLNNEKNQDGLHLTVGNMNQDIHSLHCRMYISGFEITPHLDWFWDVGNIEPSMPAFMLSLLPTNWKHELARQQMCEAAPAGMEFPEEWKQNVIEVKREPITYQGGLGYSVYDPRNKDSKPSNGRKIFSAWRDIRVAASEWKEVVDLINCDLDEKDKVDPLEFLAQLESDGELVLELIKILQSNDIEFDPLLEYMEHLEENASEKEMQAELDEFTKRQTGVPDYEGHQQLPE